MNRERYRFEFLPDVPIEEAELTLWLSVFAVESLHGQAQALLDLDHEFDADARACVIDATTAVGRDLTKIYVGYLQREFGYAAFTVERLDVEATTPAPEPVGTGA